MLSTWSRRAAYLTHGCENAVFCENTQRKIYVAWNNCFRHILNCCWRESVKPLRYFCCTLPMSYQIDLNKLLFWKKMYRPTSDNLILYSLSRLTLNRFAAVASQCGIVSILQRVAVVKQEPCCRRDDRTMPL